MIEVRNITKKYGKTTAVNDLSFTAEKGRIYGFLGPNGAGKSTAMNIITGYTAADEGEVLISGFDILKEPRKARSFIGYLPEQPPLYQEMTVYEYLRFAAELKRIPKAEIENAVEESINTLGLSDVRNRVIRNLSKGYRQRTGFAQALLGLPEVLVLDEPTSGLDPKQIIEIRSLIKDLGKKHTVLLSSHILSEVSEICDHIMIISEGRLAAAGSADELMNGMQSSTVIDLTVTGDESLIEKAMLSLSGIDEYTSAPSESDEKAFDVRIKYESGEDRRSEISGAFAAKGLAIIQMNRTRASLEDIFLQLTADSNEQEASDADDSGQIYDDENTSAADPASESAAEPEKNQNETEEDEK